MPRWYGVTSPPFYWTDVILEDGTGPTYREHDWLAVFATSARRAKVLALRCWRRRRHQWVEDAMSDGVNPFTGMEAEQLQEGKDG